MGLKSDPEFRPAFVGYIEWGTRIAVINSQLSEKPDGIARANAKMGLGRNEWTCQTKINMNKIQFGIFISLIILQFSCVDKQSKDESKTIHIDNVVDLTHTLSLKFFLYYFAVASSSCDHTC